MEEALKDVIPIEWPDAVLCGEKRVIITSVNQITGSAMGFTVEYNDIKTKESEVKGDMEKDLEYYMSLNYKLELIQDEAEGGYTALHPELNGCITCGQSLENALESLQDAKRDWLIEAIEDGINIPEPIIDENDSEPFTGSFDIQIEPDLHMKAALAALDKGMSLDEFVKEAILRNLNRRR